MEFAYCDVILTRIVNIVRNNNKKRKEKNATGLSGRFRNGQGRGGGKYRKRTFSNGVPDTRSRREGAAAGVAASVRRRSRPTAARYVRAAAVTA